MNRCKTMCAMSAGALLAALGTTASVNAGASVPSIEVIYTKLAGHPTAQVPGAIDTAGNPVATEWRGFESLVMSPGGTQWVIKGRTNMSGADSEHFVVIGSGASGQRLAQEGEAAPGGAAGERFDFFGGSSTSTFNPIGRFDEAGRFAFGGRARTGATGSSAAPNGQRIFLRDSAGAFTVARSQNDPYIGVWDLVTQPGGNVPGNEFSGNNLNSVHLLNSGVVGFCDSQIGNVAFTMRPGNFYGSQLYHQSGGIDTVTALDGVTPVSFSFSTGIIADRFATTPDGTNAMFIGNLTSGQSALILNNRVIAQSGTPAVPGIPNSGPLTNFELLPDGTWFAWGGYEAQAGFWLVRNGALLARTGTPITTGSSELWWDPLESTCRHASLSIL